MTRLPRTELIMGSRFNECGIASAELADRAKLLLAEPNATERIELFVESPVGEERAEFDSVIVCPEFKTDTGREISLVLGRKSDDPKSDPVLMAVTRGDIAFRVATFSRRVGTCDYVQIGDEIDDESLVVTPEDEQSRKDIIETLRQLMNYEPSNQHYEEIMAEGDRYSPGLLVQAIANERVRTHEVLNKWRLTNAGKKLLAALRLEESYTVDDISAPSKSKIDSYAHDVKIGYFSFDPRKGSKYTETLKTLQEFVEDPCTTDLDRIVNEELPGTDNPQVRSLLIRMVTRKLGLNRSANLRGPRQTNVALKAAQLIDIDSRIDRYLGEYRESTEKVMDSVGQLATGQMYEALDHVQMSNDVVGSIRFFVKLEDISSDVSHVEIGGRPNAMPEEMPEPIYSFDINRRAKLDLVPEDIDEASEILGRITASSR